MIGNQGMRYREAAKFMTKRIVTLSAVFISALCGTARADLIGYWPLEETSGSVATNLVPGGTNGVLVGAGVTWMNDAARGHGYLGDPFLHLTLTPPPPPPPPPWIGTMIMLQ